MCADFCINICFSNTRDSSKGFLLRHFLCESGRFTNRESLIVWVWWGEHPKLTISCIRKGKSTCMLTAHTRLLIPRREPPSCEAPRQRTIYYFIFYLKQFEFLTMALSPGAPVCYFINFGAEIFFLDNYDLV